MAIRDLYGDAIKLLSSLVSVKVFPDFVPENYTDPAIVMVNVAQPSNRVVKEGIKTGKYGVFKLSVVASSSDDVLSILNELESLDNTCHDDFQMIRMDTDFIEPKAPGQPVRRAFVTFTAYP